MKRLCKIREIQHAIYQTEHLFNEKYGICFNEGALLCILSEEVNPLTSGEISEHLGLSHSNSSKVISSAEDKGFIHRELGHDDKRHMYFNITEKGAELLKSIDCTILEIPGI
jgi:DNA-binding MarR family transcriptional regulator